MAIELDVEDGLCIDFDMQDPTQFELFESNNVASFDSDEYVRVLTSQMPTYEGPYSATPTWGTQTFETADHEMRDDFAVNAILKLEVANDFGGLTLTI